MCVCIWAAVPLDQILSVVYNWHYRSGTVPSKLLLQVEMRERERESESGSKGDEMKYLVTGRGGDLEVSVARSDSTTDSANWKTRPAVTLPSKNEIHAQHHHHHTYKIYNGSVTNDWL